jgi:peptide/nickel transport system permease protein
MNSTISHPALANDKFVALAARRLALVAYHVTSRVLRTLLRVTPTVIAVILFNFLLLELIPGDAADVLAGEMGAATADTMRLLREHLGLNIPAAQQLINYLHNLVHLNLGFSARYDAPVLDVLMSRLPATLILMFAAFVLAIVLGVSIGVAQATWKGRWPDKTLSFITVLLYSTPAFWIGLMSVVVFSVTLGWLPSDGIETLGETLTGWAALRDRLAHLILPAIALASHFLAVYARLIRGAMLEVSRQDFVRTAEAKGVHPFFVTTRHILRNALLPLTSVAGFHFGQLLGGAAAVETIFSWPGLGRLALEAVQARDFVVLLGILLLSSLLVIAVNILIDALQTWIDPRIRATAANERIPGGGTT